MGFAKRPSGAASRTLAFVIFTAASAASTQADPFPPEWTGIANCGTAGTACHFAPAAWPSEPADPANCGTSCGDWQPYTRFQSSVNDPRVQDPSNGGTRPQNYVNIASSCSDTTQPSIYYSLQPGAAPDGSEDVIMFRWRVEQIANTYATGPSPGSFGATDPWNSALWTVLFDTDGDGFRDLAAHLDGSSGSPATPVDFIAGIWGDIPTQSIDYVDDPNIFRIAHNPTAFTDSGTGRIINFQNSLSPTTSWPNGSSETIWDHGTSRARLISTNSCNEYFIDYQIPVKMLDASGIGGPSIDRNTPISMMFCTANSLNNPFQKDCAINKEWAASSTKEAPFGDYTSFDQGEFEQPIVDEIEAKGCGIFDLDAKVKDTIAIVNNDAVRTVQAVDFYYYRDDNGNGLADDGNSWQLAINGTPDPSPINAWSATWDATGILNGQYLLGVQSLDDPSQVLYDDGITSDGIAHRTFSYLTQPEVDALGTPPSGEEWFANPQATGVQSVAVAVNACGIPTPYVEKTVAQSSGTAGGAMEYTITVHNTLDSTLSVSDVTDHLPDGFSYQATTGGTLTPDATPAPGATGDVQWTFSPAATIAAGGTGTLVLEVQLPSATGTYQNTASAGTSFSPTPLESDPVAVEVGAPRLTISKSASPLSASPSTVIDYTITYSNDSPVAVTNAVITDALPDGLDYVPASASGGGVYDSGTDTLTWSVGALPAGSGSASVTFQATVADPYPATASVPLINTATIASDQTAPASDEASVFVDVPRPRLTLEKSASAVLIDPSQQVTFTLRYANTGTGTADSLTLTDSIPAGFSFVSADSGGTLSGSTVTWNLGTLAAGASGSVTLTLLADDPFGGSNPATNLATIDSAQTDPVTAERDVGVTQTGQVCETFYFREEIGNVGADGTGKLATSSPVPVPADTGSSTIASVPGGDGNYVDAVQFYQDPAAPSDVSFSGNLTTSLFIDRDSGPGIRIRATVYDYDSTTGTRVQLGQSITSFNGSATGELSFTVPLTGTLQNEHRLLWDFDVTSQNNQVTTIQFQYDGTVANNISGSGSRFADSSGEYCVTPPANLVLQKTAVPASVMSSDSLTYTIAFANTGETLATNAVITDTLPAGVTFDSATLNGAAISPTVSGNDHIFDVASAGEASGNIAGGASGELVITVTVDPLAADVTELVNSAVLDSDQTAPVTDTATTPVEGAEPPGDPQLVVDKAVDTGSLGPGDTAGYAITVLNAGTGTANNVVVTDDVPDTAYFAYVPGTIAGGDTRDDSTPGALSWTIASLAPGASVTLSFDMDVTLTGVPAGTTFLDNQAEATRDGLSGTVTSGLVPVAIVASPSLSIAKSVEAPPAAGYWAPGDVFEYTLIVTNLGDADAASVTITDAIPNDTTFESITMGSGVFEAANNRVRFDLGTLLAGDSATVAFQVRVVEPIPGDSALIDNTAVASAGNAASVQDSVSSNAQGNPVMTLQKTGPAVVPLPAATVAAATSAGTEVTVDDPQLLSLGDTVRIAGQVADVVAVGVTTVTLDQSVTVAAGDPVELAATYAVTWRNTGDGTATGVQVSDDLPAGFEYLSGTPMPDSTPVGPGGTVTWDLGDVAPGAFGTLEVTAFPTATGSFTNQATLSATNLPSDETAQADTDVGGLAIDKYTTTPVAVAGGSATWVLEIENTLPSQVTGVDVTDTLPPGFTFDAGSPVTFGGSGFTRTSINDPADGDAFPLWGEFTLQAGGSLTIEFSADIDLSVGPATYQNDLDVSSNDAVALPFDPLSTTAEDVTVLAPGTGIVEGYVYRDANNDGALNSGDVPLAGVDVEITDAASTLYIKATDSTGYFRRVVAAGSADVDVGGASDAGIPATLVLASGSSDPTTVSVPDGGTARDDTGYIPESAVPDDGTLSGHVFLDENGDGVLDAGEGGFPSVDLTITTSLGDVLSVQTDANGDFSVVVPEGDTDVDYTTPAGFELTTANDPQTVAVPGNGTASAADVGYTRQTGTVSGHVFEDLNGNGVLDIGEPGFAGVQVTITDADGGSQMVSTDASGNFNVTVPEGSTQLSYATPAGYGLTTANASQTVAVPVNGNASATDVGYTRLTGTISGHAFDDINGNGALDAGEPGFPGVQVTINDSDGGSQAVSTDASGNFSVTVPEGATQLVYTTPSGYQLTTANGSQTVSVPANGSASATDVGYTRQTGTVSGQVFEDVNGDGINDAGEPGFAGVQVTISDSDGGSQTVATDASGNFAATVPEGSTQLSYATPIGYDLTTANGSQTVSVPPSGNATASDVGYTRQSGTISGHVFADTNGDGTNDAGESGFAGVQVTITDSDGGSQTVATDASGNFTATVPEGSTELSYATPSGYDLTTANASQSVSVPASGSASAADVGYTRQTGTVAGHVFEDTNGDGVLDAGESGFPNVQVTITDSDGGNQTVSTDASGNFSVTVPEGSTELSYATPTGYELTTANASQTVAVPVDGTGDAADVGYTRQTGNLSGHVFLDDNGDGINDPGEAGFPGVDVTITDSDGATQTVSTDASGNFNVSVPEGSTQLSYTTPAGHDLTTANASQSVTVPASGSVTADDVGYTRQTGTLAGHVFEDDNGDGINDAGESGFAGVQVTITDSDGGSQTVTTDSAGNFSAPVPEGSTQISYSAPVGYELTTANASQTVIVPVDGSASAEDVGYARLTGTLQGHVFLDSNGDGALDAGEPGFDGVQVNVVDSDGGSQSVTTDANGDFSLTLPEGDADLTYTTPSGHVLTTANDTQTVAVPDGGTTAAGDVGYRPVDVPQGDITGHVFVDANGNAAQDAGEPDLAGIPIALDTSDGGTINVVTDVAGNFAASVPAGATQLNASGPAGYALTTANDSQSVTAVADATTPAADIGYRPQAGTVMGQVGVRVFLDEDGDAVRDAGEALFEGIRVLFGLPGGSSLSVLTDRDGRASAPVPAGASGVAVIGPAGYALTTANETQAVNVTGGASVDAGDVGYRVTAAANPGVLAGTVFEDLNRSAGMETGEPGLPGIRVTVTTSSGEILVVTTDDSGYFELQIPAGTTGIQVTDPADMDLTTANRSQHVNVSAGGSAQAEDVGYAQLGAALAIPLTGPAGLALLVLVLLAAGAGRLRRGLPGAG